MLERVRQYYSDKVVAHGATAKGADWNSPESQAVRFEQLLKMCNPSHSFSLNDYGCGYGALVEYMAGKNYQFRYAGYDISAQMIAKAKELYGDRTGCGFFSEETSLVVADYTVASGVFHVKLQVSDQAWEEYILHALGTMARLSSKGFAFNMLTKYSDPERMRPDLYYADPCFLFDYCKTKVSKHVALLHDYGLYEFTLLVRFDDGSPSPRS